MRILNILMLTCLLLTPVVRPGQVPSRSLTITVLYDNVAATAGTEADWGFSCFVEMGGGSVLFDTGANPEVLRANINALQVDLSRINAVVFSHEHKDHTGGVEALGARPGLDKTQWSSPEGAAQPIVPVGFCAALQGSSNSLILYPGLTPGATLFRPSGPERRFATETGFDLRGHNEG
jgi:glyoxylase-like metal-dependent hydrolase (beta-lactamase superfamily II)